MTLPTPDDMLALGALFDAADGPRPGAAPARKCRRHLWRMDDYADAESRVVEWREVCARCHRLKDHAVSRRSRNNRSRGTRDELAVARALGGRKVGELGLPWDVELPGYLRAQAKKLARWPSVAQVIEWLDAIPAGPELRAVTLADSPGPGTPVRRLIVMDLAEFSAWHAKENGE